MNILGPYFGEVGPRAGGGRGGGNLPPMGVLKRRGSADSFTLRACPPTHLHAAQFLRSAAYSQRNFLAAQFLLFLANRGGPQGWDPWDPKEGPPWGGMGPAFTHRRAPSGPLGPGGRAHGGRWDDFEFEAILNGMFFRWCFAPSHPCIAEVGQNRIHFLTPEALKEEFRKSEGPARSNQNS